MQTYIFNYKGAASGTILVSAVSMQHAELQLAEMVKTPDHWALDDVEPEEEEEN